MSIREIVGSLIESHRAKGSRPDRRNFTRQTDRLPPTLRFSFPNSEAPSPIATDLEFPATDPANAPQRAEFKLGIFPPDHHVAPAAPTPTPPATPKP